MEEEPGGRSSPNISSIWTLMGARAALTKYMAIAMLPSWTNVFPLVLRTTSMLRGECTHGDTIGEDIYEGSHSLAYLVIEQTHNYLEDAHEYAGQFWRCIQQWYEVSGANVWY